MDSRQELFADTDREYSGVGDASADDMHAPTGQQSAPVTCTLCGGSAFRLDPATVDMPDWAADDAVPYRCKNAARGECEMDMIYTREVV